MPTIEINPEQRVKIIDHVYETFITEQQMERDVAHAHLISLCKSKSLEASFVPTLYNIFHWMTEQFGEGVLSYLGEEEWSLTMKTLRKPIHVFGLTAETAALNGVSELVKRAIVKKK